MTLAYEVRGDGRPLVLLPWFSLDSSAMIAAFEPVMADQDGWRRVYVDLPGTGGSPGGVPTSDAVVDEVVAFLDSHLGDDPFALAGCSYGGYVAGALARRIPDRISGLLLVCTGEKIIAAERELPPAPTAAPPDGWLAGVPADLVDHLTAALGNRTATVATRVARIVTSSPAGDEEFLTQLHSTGYRLSDEGVRFEYPGPTAVLTGRQDLIAGYTDQLRSLVNYPDGAFSIVADAGHYLPFEQPAVFRDLVAHWLARLS